MIVIAFVCFAVLIVAWIMAPKGEVRSGEAEVFGWMMTSNGETPAEASVPAPALTVREGAPA